MSSADVEIRGMKEVLQALDQLDEKTSKRTLQKATADAAKKVLKPKVKAKAAPISARLARATRAGASRKGKPAGIVKFDNKRAWFRHFVIGGTKAHKIRFHDEVLRGVPKKGGGSIKHPGAKPHPIIAEVADQYGDDALDHVERFLVRTLELD